MKFDYIIKNISKRFVKLSWSNPQKSKIECALSMGDPEMGEVIEKAWRGGAKFDNWDELFSYEIWEKAFRETELDIGFFTTREIQTGETLPWDVVDIGPSKKFLLKEYEKSRDYN